MAAGTIGIICSPTLKPILFSASSSTTPEAAARPNAEPPDKRMALTSCTEFSGFNKSVSRVPGAAPLTSTPPIVPLGQITTVQPVIESSSVQ